MVATLDDVIDEICDVVGIYDAHGSAPKGIYHGRLRRVHVLHRLQGRRRRNGAIGTAA